MNKKIQKKLTIHLVYPHKPKISNPDLIGHRLTLLLRKSGYKVIPYDLYQDISKKSFKPENTDILLGHPRWEKNCTFNMLLKKNGWGKIIVIHPFCPADLITYGHLYNYCLKANHFIAITGNYWIKNLKYTAYSDWQGKFTHLDLAYDQKDLPKIKMEFNKPGTRKFIFIGNHPHYKNVEFLDKIASRLNMIEFHRIGPISNKFPNLIQHGILNLKSKACEDLLKTMDFMITMGTMDANPTTILEAGSMGLISVCPERSGYEEKDGVINISGISLEDAIIKINELNMLDERLLIKKQLQMFNLLKTKYTWSKFLDKVISQIENKKSHNYKFKSVINLFKIFYVYYFLSKKAPWKLIIKSNFYKIIPRSSK